MQDGRLAEWGAHEELMRRNGGYAALYRAQWELEHPEKEAASCAEAA